MFLRRGIGGEQKGTNYISVTVTPAKVRLTLHLKYTHEPSHACTRARDRGRCKSRGRLLLESIAGANLAFLLQALM